MSTLPTVITNGSLLSVLDPGRTVRDPVVAGRRDHDDAVVQSFSTATLSGSSQWSTAWCGSEKLATRMLYAALFL